MAPIPRPIEFFDLTMHLMVSEVSNCKDRGDFGGQFFEDAFHLKAVLMTHIGSKFHFLGPGPQIPRLSLSYVQGQSVQNRLSLLCLDNPLFIFGVRRELEALPPEE